MLESLASAPEPEVDALNSNRERVVVMGVSGSGKTTVGRLLGARLGSAFLDADPLHSEANKRKMAAGIALDDDDRQPWLEGIAVILREGPVVVACSALKRRYRDLLRRIADGGGAGNGAPGHRAPGYGARGDLFFVYLQGSAQLLRQRLAGRAHEFMRGGNRSAGIIAGWDARC